MCLPRVSSAQLSSALRRGQGGSNSVRRAAGTPSRDAALASWPAPAPPPRQQPARRRPPFSGLSFRAPWPTTWPPLTGSARRLVTADGILGQAASVRRLPALAQPQTTSGRRSARRDASSRATPLLHTNRSQQSSVSGASAAALLGGRSAGRHVSPPCHRTPPGSRVAPGAAAQCTAPLECQATKGVRARPGCPAASDHPPW